MTAAAQHPHRTLRWLILAGVVAVAVGLALVPDVRGFAVRAYQALTSTDPAVTHAFVDSLGWAGPLALIGGFVLQAVLPVLPALVMTAVTGRAYGPVEGFFIVYTGTLLGAAAGYGLGRWVGQALIRVLAGETARRATHEFAEKYGIQGVLMVRLMPVLSADVMNLVAGAARMGFRPFMLATAAGALPVTLLVVWLSGNTQRMMWGLGLLSLAVGIAGLGRWWLARRARTQAGQPPNHPSAEPAPHSDKTAPDETAAGR